ncbi:pyridoxamine 5'-phosphate oxidase family protein [Clostridium saccharoperbutylacetonicum]|uniref:Putative stress protein n=2 Tax=Clostridium TaxID=1485 RepID=M1MB62_9CLOT|nr:pyridoxamine 5'-phosphate oxidase family protein [Clostridium saccharoperbutylacetonicum]AGF55184.1 putative stress protein [Clostridium saccharoperbutylacetonicum N1-4(HMT)]AQR94074.1 pyridoxamine 5'-phosphate oxidase [Clostridium saccharoperbutylacetonicum]NRT64105.1 general stress protein 26 [Clostridium saccharoperbutylacetonicum]NSB27472.1 general stress protein 26 [Clostridium saccharoperbutylacetonicum]NSB29773.1 general stress protein 26 [Clostridium saccharoperbutylacetonicum]
MSEAIEKSIKYVEESKLGLLITVDENRVPFIRTIGAFSNEGANIYFLTGKEADKVKHINSNPIVTFYFEQEGQPYESFKSVSIIGDASKVTEKDELDKAIEAISVRYPVIKDKVSNGEFQESAIYVVKAKAIKLADYTQSPREQLIKL